jgi:hypothetical protein
MRLVNGAVLVLVVSAIHKISIDAYRGSYPNLRLVDILTPKL